MSEACQCAVIMAITTVYTDDIQHYLKYFQNAINRHIRSTHILWQNKGMALVQN